VFSREKNNLLLGKGTSERHKRRVFCQIKEETRNPKELSMVENFEWSPLQENLGKYYLNASDRLAYSKKPSQVIKGRFFV
jgi:hypothetical protein